MQEKTERNLGLELARATEAAALAAGQWAGRGETHTADAAATQAMTACNLRLSDASAVALIRRSAAKGTTLAVL